ncbi:MAG: Gx transporter family protein [Ruminococcaceae bacterium]|nr:Gx transporter family protein [Oscillospiraceae bacterium]
MKTRKITLMALLTAAALITFVIEAQIPPLTAIPGVKIGLSNIFTVFALWTMGPVPALCVLVVRVLLGGFLTGQPAAIIYSMAGGLMSLGVSIAVKRIFNENSLWALSAAAGVIHNMGQLLVAVWVMGTVTIAVYAPVLIISGIIAGSFTGLCVQLIMKRIRKIGKLPSSTTDR